LFGRDEELRRLVEHLGSHRLVTVMGPGGVGKTRLAIAAAHAVLDDFPDGTWLLELGELHDADDVPAAVLTTLALQPIVDTHGSSTLAALADQRALLVLDNCEHLIDAVVRLVGELDAHCDRVAVLATSREALGLGHEVRLNLKPLDVDSRDGAPVARKLFCERMAGVLGDIQPSDTDIAVIDEICRRLDGLPLAIELATARLSAMTLTELHGRLDQRFELLAGRRGVHARHQSLWATVTWSYELLSPAEQSFFDQLAVFGADFEAGAARAVGGDATVPVDDLLRSLVDKSLLTATRGPLGTRFRQLETLRRYGAARLGTRGATATMMRRQLDYYMAWTESADAGIKSPDELHWHQAFTAEWSNIRNVIRWACDVDDGDAACRLVSAVLWWATSRMRLETEQWCDLALGLPSASDHRLRPAMLAARALFAHMRSDGDRERRSLALARAEEERLGPTSEPWIEAAVLNQWQGGPAAALRDAAALRQRADGSADEIWKLKAALEEAFILATLIHVARPSPLEELGYVARIRDVVGRAEAFAQPSGLASALASLGIALRAAEPIEAETLLERALDLCTPLEVDDTSNMVRRELASLYADLGRPLDALTLMGPAIARCLRTGARHEVREAFRYIVRALADAGRPRVAATMLGHAEVWLDHLDRNYHDIPALHAQLLAELGPVDLQTLLADGDSLAVTDLAQLVVETIDELTNGAAGDPSPGPGGN
jgi:predicted ATPase